jgi:hypothetical protein
MNDANGNGDPRPRYQRLFVRVLIVQVITLLGLGLLQITFGSP